MGGVEERRASSRTEAGGGRLRTSGEAGEIEALEIGKARRSRERRAFEIMPAATYSPTQLPMQYHRR
jgi:hypothetical protein